MSQQPLTKNCSQLQTSPMNMPQRCQCCSLYPPVEHQNHSFYSHPHPQFSCCPAPETIAYEVPSAHCVFCKRRVFTDGAIVYLQVICSECQLMNDRKQELHHSDEREKRT